MAVALSHMVPNSPLPLDRAQLLDAPSPVIMLGVEDSQYCISQTHLPSSFDVLA